MEMVELSSSTVRLLKKIRVHNDKQFSNHWIVKTLSLGIQSAI